MIKGKVVTTIIYFRYSGIFNKLFSVCKFIIDRTFYGKVEIIAKNFRDTKCISGLKSFAGREGRGTCNISWHFIERENLSKKFYARR